MPAGERSARADRPAPAGLPAQPAFFDLTGLAGAAPAQQLAASLSAPRAWIAPAFFYDPLGSALFAAICELPEYYPTRTEREILDRHLPAVAQAVGAGGTLIDLGAGDCRKAESLFAALRPARYVAVDVSVQYLRVVLEALAPRHPGIEVVGVGADFAGGLRLPAGIVRGAPTFFYPGSSIGNFDAAEAAAFLRGLHGQAVAGEPAAGLLIGVDLVKPPDELARAYDDALGVTAAFNRNALAHANRVLGADFDVRDWRHVALWNAQASRIEMHLEALRPVAVRWPGGLRRFEAGERIHTENSYKYTASGFEALLRRCGWRCTHRWTDARERFALFHARADGAAGHAEPPGGVR